MPDIIPDSVKCEYCGQMYKPGSLWRHKKICKYRPDNVKKSIHTQDVNTIKPTEQPTEQPIEETQTHGKPLIITDIQSYKWINSDDLVAWYYDGQTYRSRTPPWMGILNDDINRTPVLLDIAKNGYILPVWLIEGFVGMYEVSHQFEDTNTEMTDKIIEPPKQTTQQIEEKPLNTNIIPNKVTEITIQSTPPAPVTPSKKGIMGLFK